MSPRSVWLAAIAGAACLMAARTLPAGEAASSSAPGTPWAFEPLRATPPPPLRDGSWCKTSIDPYILAHLEAADLRPAPPADRRTLLRRATYDLTGLPPAPQEVDAFEGDPSPDAFEAVVERLLDSPRYGERWGRHWLDLVRYADTAGENSDHPLPEAWRYRNWVIRAFNEDKPYDAFVAEQLAGDLLAAEGPPGAYADRIVATGYLAIARRFGHDIDKDMHLTYEDAIDTIGKSLLGLSLGCARCHDHKFDPITARDYYGLYGILESTRFAFPGCEPKQQPRDLVPLLAPAEVARIAREIDGPLAALDAEVAQLAARSAERSKQVKEAATGAFEVLASGLIDDGHEAPIASPGGEPLAPVEMRAGEVLQLSVSPRANHGADSTLIELEIAEAGGEGRRWSVADLVDDLLAGNPRQGPAGPANAASAAGTAQASGSPPPSGAASRWCFLDTRDGPVLLSEAADGLEGKAELKAWRAPGGVPSVFVNTSTEPVKVWTTLPPRAFFVHPGPSGPVAVAWICPMDGAVTVRGRVADAHPGGDGVGWLLERFRSAEVGQGLAALGTEREALAGARREQAALASRRAAVEVAYAVVEGTPADARIQQRGDPAAPGDTVPRKVPEALGGQPLGTSTSSGRLELARWITSPACPLAARVIANRLWLWHFGRGLVATPNDFGRRGALPTYPELLDHLALELLGSGWSLKALHRRILLSATYQQAACSSNAAAGAGTLQPGFPRRRLDADELRDTLLFVSGELDLEPGGPHPFPPAASWSFTQHGPFAAQYDTLKRSVYVLQKRNRRDAYFALFDGADPNATTPSREVTTVPTQALYFLNDPFVHARADGLARRVLAAATDEAGRLDAALRLLLGRGADEADRADAAAFFAGYAEALADEPPERRASLAWAAYARVLLSSNEVLHVD